MIERLPIYVDDTPELTAAQIETKCKRLTMCASRLLVHERPLVILCINNKPISEHSPDFIVQGQETLIVNLLAAPAITQADVNCVQACLDAHSRAVGGTLINFGDQRLAWMNIIQSKYKYYSRNRSTV